MSIILVKKMNVSKEGGLKTTNVLIIQEMIHTVQCLAMTAQLELAAMVYQILLKIDVKKIEGSDY